MTEERGAEPKLSKEYLDKQRRRCPVCGGDNRGYLDCGDPSCPYEGAGSRQVW